MRHVSVFAVFLCVMVSQAALAEDLEYNYSAGVHGSAMRVVIGEYLHEYDPPFDVFNYFAIGACIKDDYGYYSFQEILDTDDLGTLTVNGSAGDDHIEIVRGEYECDWANGSEAPIAMAPPTYSISYLSGLAGIDHIIGGNLADVIYGDTGDDLAYGGSGDDIISGGYGCDDLYGEEGNDTILAVSLFSSTESDCNEENELFGGTGDDVMHGSSVVDKIQGDAGNDEIWGFSGDDNLAGGSGADEIYGGNGNDCVCGYDCRLTNVTDGNDTLTGNSGTDKFCDYGYYDYDTFVNETEEYLYYFRSGRDTASYSYTSSSSACYSCDYAGNYSLSGIPDGQTF